MATNPTSSPPPATSATDFRAEENKWTVKFYEANIDKLALVGGPAAEQETVITYDRESDRATVETTDTTVFTKLRKALSNDNGENWRLEAVTRDSEAAPFRITSVCFSCPKKLISFRSRAITRVLTDEQKQAAAARLKNSRSKKD